MKPLNKWNKSADFPVINPAFSGTKNTCVYAAASSGSRPALPHFPFDMVAKLNVLNNSICTWSVDRRSFIGEPIFVPKGTEEDDGYLLVVEVSVIDNMMNLVDSFLASSKYDIILMLIIYFVCSMQLQYKDAIWLY